MAEEDQQEAGGPPRALRRQLSVIPAAIIRQAETESRLVSEAAPKISALINYLRLGDQVHVDKCLGRMGKSPDCILVAPEGGPATVHNIRTIDRQIATPISMKRDKGKNDSVPKAERISASKLLALQKEIDAMTPQQAIDSLKSVFELYADKTMLVDQGRHEINIAGFLRLMRDSSLLDNKLTPVQVDVIFTQVPLRSDSDAMPKDIFLGWDGFLAALRRLSRFCFPPSAKPAAPTASPAASLRDQGPASPASKGAAAAAAAAEEAVFMQFIRKLLLATAKKVTAEAHRIDALYSREVMDVVRTYDRTIRRVFAWYATLEETNRQRKVTWEHVRDQGLTVGRAELLLMILNFQIIPDLISRHDALYVFLRVRADMGVIRAEVRGAGAMTLPMALEALAALALQIADAVETRLGQTEGMTSEELRKLMRYVQCCGGAHRDQLDELVRKHAGLLSPMRSTRASSPGDDADSIADSPYAPQIQAMRKTVEAREEQRKTGKVLDTINRREDLRQKFALTRLSNYYKDVRSSSVVVRVSGGGVVAVGEAPLTGEEWGGGIGEVPVAFFSDSRQIKTPKPSRVGPAGLMHNGSFDLHHLAASEKAVPSSPNSQGRQAVSSPRVERESFAQTAQHHNLKIDVMAAARSMEHSELIQFVSSICSPHNNAIRSGWHSQPGYQSPPALNGGGGGGGYWGGQALRSPGHQPLAPIEARDESEAILQLAKALPALRLPQYDGFSSPSSSRSDAEQDGGGEGGEGGELSTRGSKKLPPLPRGGEHAPARRNSQRLRFSAPAGAQPQHFPQHPQHLAHAQQYGDDTRPDVTHMSTSWAAVKGG